MFRLTICSKYPVTPVGFPLEAASILINFWRSVIDAALARVDYKSNHLKVWLTSPRSTVLRKDLAVLGLDE